MNNVYLLLGSNLDDRFRMLEKACALIDQEIGKILIRSSLYESEPWGFFSENLFLNQALMVETDLTPAEIMERIIQIEGSLGRKRHPDEKYISRTIDIDILFFNHEIIRREGLIIPHPRIRERKFALIPLSEIDPDFVHPGYLKTIHELVRECPDRLNVDLFQTG